MDAVTLYGLLKPHLERLDHAEKFRLSKMISNAPANRNLKTHRKVHTLKNAIENLNRYRQAAVALERRSKSQA